MTVNDVTPLFILFSGQNDQSIYEPIIEGAIKELQNMLLDDIDTEDELLNFTAAAIANFRYSQIFAARDKISYTPAGTVAQNNNGNQKFDFAKSLMLEYLNSISKYLKDNFFESLIA
jgi:hypothetical protein